MLARKRPRHVVVDCEGSVNGIWVCIESQTGCSRAPHSFGRNPCPSIKQKSAPVKASFDFCHGKRNTRAFFADPIASSSIISSISMSTDDLEGEDIWGTSAAAAPAAGEAGESKQADDDDDEPPPEDEETRHMSVSELKQRIHLLSSDIRVMKSDIQRINHESRDQRERIRENQEKVKMNKQLPYLVANVVEVLEPDAEDGACIFFFSFSSL
jgi:uncharacterized small protein (DUF1192 family)